MNRNTIVTGVVALVVGLLIGWFIGHGASTSKTVMTGDKMMANTGSMMDDNMMEDDSMMDDGSMMMDSEAAILVTDQSAGNTVTVASVETDAVTWVAVRDNTNGVMGNILGAARIEAGASNNIVVSLLRPTMANKDYFVVLFNDNGDRMFDHHTDMMAMSDGAMISQTFHTLAQ